MSTDFEIQRVEPGFGITALNRLFRGVRDGKRYVFQAATGRMQHLLAVQLVRGAMAEGHSVLVLTNEDPDALVLQGTSSGLDITQPLSVGRLHVVRYAPAFRELASSPAQVEGLLSAWRDQLASIRPHRVIFLGWPRVIDHDVKLLRTMERMEHDAVDTSRAACVFMVDPNDLDRYGRDVRRRAFADVRFKSRGVNVWAEVIRGPVPADSANLEFTIEHGRGLVENVSAPAEVAPAEVTRDRVVSGS